MSDEVEEMADLLFSVFATVKVDTGDFVKKPWSEMVANEKAAPVVSLYRERARQVLEGWAGR